MWANKMWVNYEDWKFLKEWNAEMDIKAIKEYMSNHKGILDQLINSDKYRVEKIELNLELLNNYLNELSMSKNKQQVVKEAATEDNIKQVMELYKPNFVQKLFMKYFSPIETNKKVRQATTTVAGVLAIGSLVFGLLGLHQTAVTLGVTTLVIVLPCVAGIVYNYFTNKTRVKQIMDILSLTEAEVVELERKYYVG
jgi:hypothetical protein